MCSTHAPPCTSLAAGEHHGERHITFRVRNTSFKKAPFVGRQKRLFCWRSGWDSNPRAIALKLISSQPRYDHFDTAAYLIFFARWRELSSQPRYVLLRCPKFSARCPLAKFRPLPLLFARFFRHRRRSQTSPLRYRCIALPIMPQLFPACKGFFANCQHILAA